MQTLSVDESASKSAGSTGSFFSKTKNIILVAAGGIGAALVITGIVLAIVYAPSSEPEVTVPTTRTTTTQRPTQTTTATTTTTTTRDFIYERLNSRIDCLPWLKNKPGVTNLTDECARFLACEYDSVDGNVIIPSCYLDTDAVQVDFLSVEQTRLGESYLIAADAGAGLTQTRTLRIDFEYLEDTVLRFKIWDPTTSDYEVPIKVNKPVDGIKAKNPEYEIVAIPNRNAFSFKIIRKATQTVIWDTAMGPIIWEKFTRIISTYLPSTNIYGFGENKHESFRHDFQYKNWAIFNRDEAPENVPQGNLYGSQPFYTCMERFGMSHGVALVNSNAMEYELVPHPGLIYRTTGGVFDFYLFMGPEPENVVQQFTKYFGRPFLPPYWSLGFSVSRYGHDELVDVINVFSRFQENQIPLDTMVFDIDHYDERAVFTVDPDSDWAGTAIFIDNVLHKQGLKSVVIFDPAIPIEKKNYWPYTEGRLRDVFIKHPRVTEDFGFTNSTIMVAACWPDGPVAYPDFFKKSAQDWWIYSILRHHKSLPFDGIWIDMNDPAAFGTNEEKPFNWPPNREPWSLKCPDDDYELVKTKASYAHKDNNKLSDKTLCMNGLQGEANQYRHFDVHNLYGHMHLIPSYEASKLIRNNKRGLVYSRSTFLGSGQYGGHWTGDNHSRWSHLYYSIIGMLEFNLFGIPYVGADICGFFEDTTVELCARWSSLGAFYPFSRNHNGQNNIPQDPGALGPIVVSAAKQALNIRYEILPYYYTLFYKAHTQGHTVARPLFHEFSKDVRTYPLDKQFLIGPAVLITPVLVEGATTVTGYFPASQWYDYRTGEVIANESDGGKFVTLQAPIDYIPVHVRGGYIIPTQGAALTTEASRNNPFGLIVAPDENSDANGDLFYDDGESELSSGAYYYASLTLRDNILRMDVEKNDYADMNIKVLDTIRILTRVPTGIEINFVLNKRELLSKSKIRYEANEIVLFDLQWPMNKSLEIEWELEPFFPPGSFGPVIDCALDISEITKDECKARGCDFIPIPTPFLPTCKIPETKGYTLVSQNDNNYRLQPIDNGFQIFPNRVDNLVISVSHGSALSSREFRMTRITIQDNDNNQRYRIPVTLNFNERDEADPFLDVTVANNPLSRLAYISVKDSSGKTLFDTLRSEHGLSFYDQFIQIVLNLRDFTNLYGFGENTHPTLRHSFSYNNWWPMFARDEASSSTGNLYGVHPFFMAVDHLSGRAFGVLFWNSNAQEYGTLPPAAITYRTTGGIVDMFIMEEESPERLTMAYHSLIGLPYMPPYWSLGFHLSKNGYGSLEKLQEAVDRTLKAHIPLDVQYADIDHLNSSVSFTINQNNYSELYLYVEDIQEKGMRFMTYLDPSIDVEQNDYRPYTLGRNVDAFIRWPDGPNPQDTELGGNNPYLIGYVRSQGRSVFPDFWREDTQTWWINEIVFHHRNKLNFDGVCLDKNEPANTATNGPRPPTWPANRPLLECPPSLLEIPPYLPLAARPLNTRKQLSDKTICMSARQGPGARPFNHYDVHNLYGWSQTEPTLRALRTAISQRPIVISRSTFPSSGTYAGHSLGDNRSTWADMKLSIISMIEFNLFGIPFVGADVCGYYETASAELCTRWMQLGAFSPFFRNNNGNPTTNQDPAAFGEDVADASRRAVELRYSLLPFLYTLFYDANIDGGTVIRALMHEFPTDVRAYDIDEQFMWGSALLISPVLRPNTRSVLGYLPAGVRWFDFYTGQELEAGRTHEFDAPLNKIPLHIRGGSIIITQDPALNTHLSRKNPYRLIVAPYAPGLLERGAFGYMYHDSGVSIDPSQESSIIDFSYFLFNNQQNITMKARQTLFGYDFEEEAHIDSIRLYGCDTRPTSIRYKNGTNIFTYEYNSETKVLDIIELDIFLVRNLDMEITIQ